MAAIPSLHSSVRATLDAGEKVYWPLTWHTLKRSIATDWMTTSVRKEPSCCAYSAAELPSAILGNLEA